MADKFKKHHRDSESTWKADLSFHLILFHFIIFIQGKYSSLKNVDLQTALLQKKRYKITVKKETIKYVKVKER